MKPGAVQYDVAVEVLEPLTALPFDNWDKEAVGIVGVILSLLIAFRNKVTFDRWWEGRILWGKLINDSRNLVLKAKAAVPLNEVEASELADLVGGFAHALLRHLRGSGRLQDNPKYQAEVEQPAHVPMWFAARVFSLIDGWRRQNRIDGFTLLYLEPHASALMDVSGACERIRNTPLPPTLRGILRLGIALYLAYSPLVAVKTMGGFAIPAVLLAGYILLVFEMASEIMENPFGTEADDLDLERYVKVINDSVMEIAQSR
jgi:ion channel-forming bestrophin family protein